MKIDDRILKSEEQVILKLRDIYQKHGYFCFKMGKFEEYDLYGQNKDFLVSDRVITFTDTDGKLMALKPDVTLSIVKNHKNEKNGVQRVYYNENVYRVSEKTHCYKEIMQTGLECLGEVTEYNLFEVVALAAYSLTNISSAYVLNISHLGVLSVLLSQIENEEMKAELLACISEKNAHGIREIGTHSSLKSEIIEMLVFLTEAYGEPEMVFEKFRKKTQNKELLAALSQLEYVTRQVKNVTEACIRVDLSLVSDMNYYNGLVFQGFVKGIPTRVLSGGQYDKLMAKMGKNGGAIGFAVYLDLLERMKTIPPYDVDVLLLYHSEDDMQAIHNRVSELIKEGKSVSVQTVIPDKLIYRELEVLEAKSGGVKK